MVDIRCLLNSSPSPTPEAGGKKAHRQEPSCMSLVTPEFQRPTSSFPSRFSRPTRSTIGSRPWNHSSHHGSRQYCPGHWTYLYASPMQLESSESVKSSRQSPYPVTTPATHPLTHHSNLKFWPRYAPSPPRARTALACGYCRKRKVSLTNEALHLISKLNHHTDRCTGIENAHLGSCGHFSQQGMQCSFVNDLPHSRRAHVLFETPSPSHVSQNSNSAIGPYSDICPKGPRRWTKHNATPSQAWHGPRT